MNAADARFPVVTAFVRWRGLVLLLRRAAGVSTFPGWWSAVSGGLEREPLAQALLEIEEETALPAARLELLAEGLPLRVAPARGAGGWLVHPFLFAWRGDEPPHVILNWENSEARWVAPAEFGRLRTVPGLGEAFRRMADPAAMEQALSADREHGASTLTERLLDLVAALAEGAGWRAAAAASARVCVAQPDLAPLSEVSRRAAAQASAAGDSAAGPPAAAGDLAAAGGPGGAGGPGCVAEGPRAVVSAWRQEHAAAAAAAAGAAAAALADREIIFTLSRSSSVEEVARRLPRRRWVVAASEPGGEGCAQASRLAALGADTTLMPDGEFLARLRAAGSGAGAQPAASRGPAAAAAAALLLGADAVLPDGAIVNKVGSRPAATAARAAGLPVVVVAHPWKRWSQAAPTPAEDGGAALFETIEAALITLLCGAG